MLSNFEGKRMIVNYFGHSGNNLKSGKLSSGMGGRFRPESTVAAIHFNRNKLYIRYVLTHTEYDKDKWKE